MWNFILVLDLAQTSSVPRRGKDSTSLSFSLKFLIFHSTHLTVDLPAMLRGPWQGWGGGVHAQRHLTNQTGPRMWGELQYQWPHVIPAELEGLRELECKLSLQSPQGVCS